MTYLWLALKWWPLIGVITLVIACRFFHNAKVRDERGPHFGVFKA